MSDSEDPEIYCWRCDKKIESGGTALHIKQQKYCEWICDDCFPAENVRVRDFVKMVR